MRKALESFAAAELDEVFPHPAIREVAFEIRFAPRLRVSAELWKLQDQLADHYPAVGTEPLFQPNGAMLNIHVFQNSHAARVIKVSHENFVIAFNKYSRFEDFKDEVIQKVSSFCTTFQITSLTRIGLRYVNDIVLPRGETIQSLLRFVHPFTDFERVNIDAVEQFVNEVRLRHKDHLVTIRGVLLAPLEGGRHIYVLDIDCHSAIPQTSDNIPELLDEYHDTAQRFFLEHITEEYKQVMRAKA